MDKKRLEIILSELEKVISANTDGDIVELGCYTGTTSLFIRRLLDSLKSDRSFHAYDSFAGLPAKTIEDASVAGSDFKGGELKASKRDLVRNFKKAGLRPPIIHKAWFNELEPYDLPDVIAFAFIDSDFYRSIIDSLNLVWPRLAPGGAVIVDDFMRSHLPGATRAVNDFFRDKQVKVKHHSNLALIYKNS